MRQPSLRFVQALVFGACVAFTAASASAQKSTRGKGWKPTSAELNAQHERLRNEHYLPMLRESVQGTPTMAKVGKAFGAKRWLVSIQEVAATTDILRGERGLQPLHPETPAEKSFGHVVHAGESYHAFQGSGLTELQGRRGETDRN
jgi:hypothetical protein